MAKTIITLTTTQENDTVVTQQIENQKDIRKSHHVIDELANYLPVFEKEFDKEISVGEKRLANFIT